MQRVIHPSTPRKTALFLFVGLLVATSVVADGGGGAFDHHDRQGNQFLLEVAEGELAMVLDRYDLVALDEQPASTVPSLLVAGPEGMAADLLVELLAEDPSVIAVEAVSLSSLPLAAGGQAGDAELYFDLGREGVSTHPCADSAGFWSGFGEQRAAERIRLDAAQQASHDCGAVTVAVIDTGVDPSHPLLGDALVPGWDFLLDQPGLASEWSMLDQSVEAILEESMRALADQSVEAILEGDGELVQLEMAMAPLVDVQLMGELPVGDLPPFFGHGTMVAGLVRLVAPAAKIMPLRVFDGSGSGHVWDIVRAIYYAVDHGADVINMSFSTPHRSRELEEALRYARRHGVVCVASAGNQGSQALVFPAAYSESIGVAATTHDDELSDFSNYGSALVKLGAPGAGVVSSFPGGFYAAGWGTSFSAPLVTGTVALFFNQVEGRDAASVQERVNALRLGSEPVDGLEGAIGSGRLDALGSTVAADL